jgi:AhpD family alkylhydroperoxidase
MELTSNLPGIVGLFNYSPASAKPMKELAEEVLRDPGFSVIEPGRRELIAAFVSMWNDCKFCRLSHRAVATQMLGEQYVDLAMDKGKMDRYMAQMLIIAADVTNTKDSRAWKEQILMPIVSAPPAEDEEMTEVTGRPKHDIILIASMFNMYNRYVSHMEVAEPGLTWDDYMIMGKRIIEVGYANSQS